MVRAGSRARKKHLTLALGRVHGDLWVITLLNRTCKFFRFSSQYFNTKIFKQKLNRLLSEHSYSST